MYRHFQDQALDLAKRERTRAALMDSVINVVAQKGMEAATINEITRQSGLSQGTFYNHFDGRDELIMVTAIALFEEFEAHVSGKIGEIDPGCQRLIVAFYVGISFLSGSGEDKILLTSALSLHPQIRGVSYNKLKEDIRAGIREGSFSVQSNELLYRQITSIALLAAGAKEDAKRFKKTKIETCEAILRLLGQTPKEAKSCVAAALKSID